ncbi:hypothetical protein BDW71DRAFT_41263 [Aspergillus fruticulosus]
MTRRCRLCSGLPRKEIILCSNGGLGLPKLGHDRATSAGTRSPPGRDHQSHCENELTLSLLGSFPMSSVTLYRPYQGSWLTASVRGFIPEHDNQYSHSQSVDLQYAYLLSHWTHQKRKDEQNNGHAAERFKRGIIFSEVHSACMHWRDLSSVTCISIL